MENRKGKVSFLSLQLSLTFLLIIASPYISQRINNIIKLCIEIMLIATMITGSKLKRKAVETCIPTIIFLCSTCFSSFRWSGLSSRFMNTFVTGTAYVLFFYIIYSSCKIKQERVNAIIKNNLIFYIVILDFFVLVTRGKGLGGLSEAVYLLGNKFMVSYFHMALLALIIGDYKKKSNVTIFKIILLSIYSVMICRIADTTTGVLGIIFMLFFWFVANQKPNIYKLLSNPIVIISFFVGSNAIFLLSNIIINNSVISNFLLEHSHTDTLLSGRLPMYKIVMNAISTNWVWGYGINYDIVQATLSFGNAQNGLLKMILDYGVVGTVAFIMIIFFAFKKSRGSCQGRVNVGIISFIYGMLFCSLVEINLDALFFLFLALAAGNQKIMQGEMAGANIIAYKI